MMSEELRAAVKAARDRFATNPPPPLTPEQVRLIERLR
jgi:hypothetical protein